MTVPEIEKALHELKTGTGGSEAHNVSIRCMEILLYFLLKYEEK